MGVFMEEDDQRRIIGHLNEKRDLLEQMLIMTKKVNFKGNEDDPEKYIGLMDDRQELMDKIAEIDGKIDECVDSGVKLADNFSGDNRKLVTIINDNIKSVAAQILEADSKNKDVSKRIMDDIRQNLQNLQKNKVIRNMYDDGFSAQGGHFFDKKK